MSYFPLSSLTSTPASGDGGSYELVIPESTPLTKLLTPNLVAIFVGPKRRAFHLHRDLLCDRSTYFKAAFLGKFAEAGTNELFMPDDNDAAFDTFVNWLYGAALTTPATDEDLETHFALLALSEKLMLECLGNQCLDAIRGYYRNTKAMVRARDIAFIYENTQGRPVRIFIVRLAALQMTQQKVWRGFPPGFRELVDERSSFWADYAWYLMGFSTIAKKSSDMETLVETLISLPISCAYHSHDYTPKCKGGAFEPLKTTAEIERRWQTYSPRITK